MATALPITPLVVTEVVRSVYTPTPVTRGFSRLLVELAALIEAERDFEDADIWDPAFVGWLSAAEHALARVKDRLRLLRATGLRRREDRPLHRMADMINTMIMTEEPGVFLAHYHELRQDRSGLRCPGDGAVALRVNRLLATGLSRIDELAGLSCFIDEFVAVPPSDIGSRETGPSAVGAAFDIRSLELASA